MGGAAGAGLADAAALAAAPSFFNSSTLFESSATRVSSAFFAWPFEICSSGPFAFGLAAPLLSVSLSGAGAAPCLLSLTEAWTLPLAVRAEPSVRAAGTPDARRWR